MNWVNYNTTSLMKHQTHSFLALALMPLCISLSMPAPNFIVGKKVAEAACTVNADSYMFLFWLSPLIPAGRQQKGKCVCI